LIDLILIHNTAF